MVKKGMKGFIKTAHKHSGPEEAEDNGPALSVMPRVDLGQSTSHASIPAASAISPSFEDGEMDGEEGSEGPETRSKLLQRHTKEMTAHKKAIQRMGKKSKDELTKLNQGIEQRHAKELQECEDRERSQAAAVAPPPPAAAAAAANAATAGAGDAAATAGDAAATAGDGMTALSVHDEEDGGHGGRQSKAQKRRQKLAQQEAEREARNAEERAALGPGAAAVEAESLAAQLLPLGLTIRDIRADGHCLYRALEDQLRQYNAAAAGPHSSASTPAQPSPSSDDNGTAAASLETSISGSCSAPAAAVTQHPVAVAQHDYLALRALAAKHMLSHPDDFLPFLDEEDGPTSSRAAGGGGGEDESRLEAYCREVEETAAWGGQLELTALAQALHCQIQVHSVGLPTVTLGEPDATAAAAQEAAGSGCGAAARQAPLLRLCYLRHAFGLGEHYNSVEPLKAEAAS